MTARYLDTECCLKVNIAVNIAVSRGNILLFQCASASWIYPHKPIASIYTQTQYTAESGISAALFHCSHEAPLKLECRSSSAVDLSVLSQVKKLYAVFPSDY